MFISKLYKLYLTHRNITTDSRQVTPQSIFFALKGPNFDGHAFVEEALCRGASYVVIDDA